MPHLFGFGDGVGKEPQHPPGTYLLMGYFACSALDLTEMLGHFFISSKHRLSSLWERKKVLNLAIYL